MFELVIICTQFYILVSKSHVKQVVYHYIFACVIKGKETLGKPLFIFDRERGYIGLLTVIIAVIYNMITMNIKT